MITSKLRVNLSRLESLRRATQARRGPTRDTLDDFERLYRAYAVERFDVFSRGSGTWPRLKPETVRRKRKNKNLILVHTRFMRLRLAAAIKTVRRGERSITVGFSMAVQHPDSDLRVDELLSAHDQGLGNLPRRRVLVSPNERTTLLMRAAAARRHAAFLRGR